MDTDNSGAITFDELKAGLRRYGSTMKDTEIRDLMDAVSALQESCVLRFLFLALFLIWLTLTVNDLLLTFSL